MPNARCRKAGDHSQWEAHRELLRVLWLEEKKTLDQIREFMAVCHSFHAEKWVYETKFREWNFRKKLRGVDWGIIGDIVGKRKLEGKDSDVYDNDTLVPSKKVRKETGRNRAQLSGNTGHGLPPGVEIRTPKMVSSNQVAQTKRRSHRFTGQPLLPRLEPRPSYADPTPWLLTDLFPNFSLDAFGEGWDVSSVPRPNDELLLLNSMTQDNDSIMLPFWATRGGFVLQDLPWVRFHALLYSSSSPTVLNSPVQGVLGFAGGAIAEQFDQQARDSASVTDAVAVLKKQRGGAFDLEEVMPEPFRIDVSNTFQAVNTPSKNSSTIQMADVSLFLTANNLLAGHELVALIRRILEANLGHILEKFFTLRSPTIQAFSCRILESLSAESNYLGNSSRLLQRLLRCGLDHSILAGPTGGRCLQLAIHHKNEAFALLLLRTGVPKNPKLGSMEPFNRTAVELARVRGEQIVLRVLLGQHQEHLEQPSPRLFVEPQRSEVELALRKACEVSDFEQIRLLLNSGVDVDCNRNSSSNKSILEWVFFEDRQSYDIMLPYSQFAKHFWTVSGILSAANAGQQELDTYFACKRCPEEDDACAILERAISAGLEYNKTQEIRTILDLEWVSEWLDPDGLLRAAAICGKFDIMAKLVELGADLEALDSAKEIMDDHLVNALIGGPEKGILKVLLDTGCFSLEDAFTKNLQLMNNPVPVPFFILDNLRFLVEQGLDLNTDIFVEDDDEMSTPLQLTMVWGILEQVEYLIDAGALVNNTASEASHTALGAAVRQMTPELVKLLLERGADVGVFANDEDMTLLELSVSRHSTACQATYDMIEVFQVLLEAGADLNGPTSRVLGANWNTALTTAIMNPDADEQIHLALDAGADIHQIGGGKMARTPLQAAVESGRTDITKELLKRGACVNTLAAPDHGRTALQAACEGGNRSTEMISLLLDAGADASAPAALKYGRTALQALCSSEAPSSELMALLIKQGADINAPPAKHGGITALQGAAIMGNIKIVMLLIDMGADINALPSEREGRMALDGAAEHGRLDTVQLLLSFEAKCMTPGSSGYDSALRLAEGNGHFAIADILRGTNGGFERELFDSGWFESLRM